jgi:hypothetical protein
VERSPVLEVDTSISGQRVTRALDQAIDAYGKPRRLIMDNGPEFTSRALLEWAGRRNIELVWIDPGKPIQNAYIESFNARFRDECLNQHHFTTLADARGLIEAWRQDYNHVRPHTSLGPEPGQSASTTLSTRNQKHPRTDINRGTTSGTGSSLLLTFLNVNIVGITDGEGTTPWDVVLLALLFAALGAILCYRLAPRTESLDESGSVSMMKQKHSPK